LTTPTVRHRAEQSWQKNARFSLKCPKRRPRPACSYTRDYRIAGSWAKPIVMELPLRAGDVLAGRYLLERQLGEGGMGLVYAATHVDLGRRVAIKVLRAESGDSAAVAARFLLEARATARLNGPHVAKVLDIGRFDEQTPFLVMEYLEGSNLQQVLVEQGSLPVARSVDYLLDACEALAEAHWAGIVHRDLKPANLFLTKDAYGEPSIKVLDFGISKFLEPTADEALGLTDSRALMGSPVYMSPEQMRSARDVDHRTDIWSLGAVLFELLSGRPIWTGQSLSELCAQVSRDPAPELGEFCSASTPELSAIVARCLQKDVALRYQQVTDLALALERFASPHGKATLPHVLVLGGHQSAHHLPTDGGHHRDASLVQASTESTLKGTAATHAHVKRSRLPMAALGTLLLVATAAFFWLRSASSTHPASNMSSASAPPSRVPMPLPAIAETPLAAVTAAVEAVSPSATVQPAASTSTVFRSKKTVAAPRQSAPRTTSAPMPSTDPMSIRK
jgi:eukaryotic-like serine/threonine-protein kinase